jgi:hypothetical protein
MNLPTDQERFAKHKKHEHDWDDECDCFDDFA